MQPRSNSRRRPISTRTDVDDSVLLETDSNTCPARHILDEKTERGKRLFLVDWAPTWEPSRNSDYPIRHVLRVNKEAGRVSYLINWEPTWTSEVTHDILSEWEQRGRVSVAPSLSDSSIHDDQEPESQSPRPPNWRRTSGLKRLAKSPEAPPAKRNRGPVPDSLSEASSPGWDPSALDQSPAEPASPSRQTYSLSTTHRPDITVDLPKNSNLDPSEYLSIDGTQTTHQSSQSLSQLESQDSILAINKELFPLEIPDSQDPTQSSESGGQPWPIIADSQDPLLSSVRRTHLLEISDAPVASVEGIVPDSALKAVDIPSRQQVSFENTTSTSTIAANAGSSNTTRHQEQASPLRIYTSSSQEPCQQPRSTQPSTQGNRPYLSQPLFDLQLSQISSISGDLNHPRDIESFASHTIEDIQAASDHGQHSRESDQSAQAAQIVDPHLAHSSPDRHNPSLEISIDSLTGRGLSQPSASFSAQSGPSFRQGITPRRARILRLSSPEPNKMDESREKDMQDPTEIPNATDQIKGILDFSTYETITDVAMPSMFPIDDTPVAASMPATATGSSVPSQLHQAQVTIQSQPVSLASPSHTLDTVTPREVLKFGNLEVRNPDTPLFLDEPATLEDPDSSHEALPMGQRNPDLATSSPEDEPYQEKRQWVVTLPFAAALRPVYDDILLSYRRPAQQYSRCLTDEISQEPSSDLVQSVDELFTKLQEVCNFPPNLHGTALETLSAREKAKYAHDSNAKISFIYELLQDITENSEILIVAQSVELLRLLHDITEALNVQCISSAIETDPQAFAESAARVTLALSTESVDRLEEYDMIIGYDRSFKTSSIAIAAAKAEIGGPRSGSRLPLILMLVTTFSFEHFDLYVDYGDSPLERRQALLYSLFEARRVVVEPDSPAPEPHEIAERFSEKLNGNNDLIAYSQTEMMSDLLHPGTQESETQGEDPENDRKRKHDDDEDESYKRVKAAAELAPLSITQMPPVPDDVQRLLDTVAPVAALERQTFVNVPLAALQGLVQQFAELKRKAAAVDLEAETDAVVSQLSARVTEFERTADQTYEALRSAVEERHRFETEKVAAESKLAKEVEGRKKDGEKAAKRITELEADVSRLTGGGDAAEQEESPLARSERLLKETQEKLTLSEKRVTNAQDDREYMRTQYQTASAAASAASSEMDGLKNRLEKAETEAAGKKLEIQKINLEHNSRHYLRRISELESLVKERNTEFDRVREELRVLRNGRRETRQVSVPRSPRMGMMSPRAPVRSYPGSASRSGSPAPGADIASFAGGSVLPGMQLFPPSAPANGRHSNLRE